MIAKTAKALLRLGKKFGLGEKLKPDHPEASQAKQTNGGMLSIPPIPAKIAKTFFKLFLVATVLGRAAAAFLTIEEIEGSDAGVQLDPAGVLTLATKTLKEFSAMVPGLLATTTVLSYLATLAGGAMISGFNADYNFVDNLIGEAAAERKRKRSSSADSQRAKP